MIYAEKIVALIQEMGWVGWLISAISLQPDPVDYVLDILPFSTDPYLTSWCCIQISTTVHVSLGSESSHQVDLARAMTILDDVLLRLQTGAMDMHLSKVLSSELYPALETYIIYFDTLSVNNSCQDIFKAACQLRGRLDLMLGGAGGSFGRTNNVYGGTTMGEKRGEPCWMAPSRAASLAWAAVLDVNDECDDSMEQNRLSGVAIAAHATVAALFGDLQECVVPEDPDPASPAKILFVLLDTMKKGQNKPKLQQSIPSMATVELALLPYLCWELATRVDGPIQRRRIVNHVMTMEDGLYTESGFERWATKKLALIGNMMKTVSVAADSTTVGTERHIDAESSQALFAAALLIPQPLIVMLLDKILEEDAALKEATLNFFRMDVPTLLSYSVNSMPVVCSYVREALAADDEESRGKWAIEVAITADPLLTRSLLSLAIIPTLQGAEHAGKKSVQRALKAARKILEREPQSLTKISSTQLLDFVLPMLRPEGRVRRVDLDGWSFSMSSDALQEGFSVCKACLKWLSQSPELMEKRKSQYFSSTVPSKTLLYAHAQRCRNVWERADVVCSILDIWVIDTYLDGNGVGLSRRVLGPDGLTWLARVWTPAASTDALVVAAALLLPCLTDEEADGVLAGMEYLVRVMPVINVMASPAEPSPAESMELVFALVCRALKALAGVPDLVAIAGEQVGGTPMTVAMEPSAQRRVAVARLSRCLGLVYHTLTMSQAGQEKQTLISKLQSAHRAFVNVKECLAVLNTFRYDETQLRVCCLLIASDLKAWSRLL